MRPGSSLKFRSTCFLKRESTCLSLSEGRTFNGYPAIAEYYHDLIGFSRKNGDITTDEILSAQALDFISDTEAKGSWLSWCLDTHGSAYGIETVPFELIFSVGRVTASIVRERAGWRILTFERRQVFELPPHPFYPEKGGGLVKNHPELWPQPPVSMNQWDPAPPVCGMKTSSRLTESGISITSMLRHCTLHACWSGMSLSAAVSRPEGR